jgi:hypothetical protein
MSCVQKIPRQQEEIPNRVGSVDYIISFMSLINVSAFKSGVDLCFLAGMLSQAPVQIVIGLVNAGRKDYHEDNSLSVNEQG